VRPDVPGELLRVLERGGAREPAGRFPSAEAYEEALEEALRVERLGPLKFFRRFPFRL
jgi:hypothetical protein